MTQDDDAVGERVQAVERAAAEICKLRPYGMKAVDAAIDRANEAFRALLLRQYEGLSEGQVMSGVAYMIAATSKIVTAIDNAQAASLRADLNVMKGARPVAPRSPAND